jgi:hypothetical protein
MVEKYKKRNQGRKKVEAKTKGEKRVEPMRSSYSRREVYG